MAWHNISICKPIFFDRHHTPTYKISRFSLSEAHTLLPPTPCPSVPLRWTLSSRAHMRAARTASAVRRANAAIRCSARG
eukprot:6193252-Pleurochrysis_carterae.AAC.2